MSSVSTGLLPAPTITPRGPGQRLPARQLRMTTSQVASYLGISQTTVRRWCEQGYLRGYRTPGGQRRFSREQLEAFVVSLADRAVPLTDEHAAPADQRARDAGQHARDAGEPCGAGEARQPLIRVVPPARAPGRLA